MAGYIHGDARGRRKMLASMGLASPIPSVAVQRSWAYIDDRCVPEGEADGEFATYITWVNKASSWIGWTGAKCFDAKDRPCRNGGDMMRARDEDAFPVRWYWTERFPAPVIPTKRELAIIASLATEPKSADNVRAEAGVKRYALDKLYAYFEKGEIQFKIIGQVLHVVLTDKGHEHQQWWKAAAFRAECV